MLFYWYFLSTTFYYSRIFNYTFLRMCDTYCVFLKKNSDYLYLSDWNHENLAVRTWRVCQENAKYRRTKRLWESSALSISRGDFYWRDTRYRVAVVPRWITKSRRWMSFCLSEFHELPLCDKSIASKRNGKIKKQLKR